MALDFSLNLTVNGNKVEGASRDGSIAVKHFHYKVKSERNPKSGAIVGSRHGLFVIRKQLDQTTPIFHNMLLMPAKKAISNHVELFAIEPAPFSPSSPNGEQKYMVINLVAPQVVAIEATMPDYGDPESRNIHEYEDIHFVYKEIRFRGLVPGSGGTVEVKDAEGKFWIDWAWQAARVHAAKYLAKLATGEDAKEEEKKKPDDKKEDKDKNEEPDENEEKTKEEKKKPADKK